MNQILARNYVVTMTIRTAVTIRAMSLEEAQSMADDLSFNERDYINIEINGNDADWISVSEAKAEEKES